MKVSTALAKRIRGRRSELGELSQRDLAARSGLSQGFISRIERGGIEISDDTAYRLALALEEPITWIDAGLAVPSVAEEGWYEPAPGQGRYLWVSDLLTSARKRPVMIPKQFGAVVKRRRAELHLTQLWLANRCGLTDVWVSSIERGGVKVSKSGFITLLDSLGVPTRVSRYVFDDGLYADGLQTWKAILDDGRMRRANGHVCHPDGSHTIPPGSRVELPVSNGGFNIRFADGRALWVYLDDAAGPDPQRLGKHGEIPADSRVVPVGFSRLGDTKSILLFPGESVDDAFTDEEQRLVGIWRDLLPEARSAGLHMLEGLRAFGAPRPSTVVHQVPEAVSGRLAGV